MELYGSPLKPVEMSLTGSPSRRKTIRGEPEVTLVRHGETADSQRFIRAYGRDVDQPERPLLYDEATRHLTLGDGISRKKSREGGEDSTMLVLQKIVTLLKQEPGLSGRQCVSKIGGHSKSTIYGALTFGCLEKVLRAEGPKQSRCYFLNVTQ